MLGRIKHAWWPPVLLVGAPGVLRPHLRAHRASRAPRHWRRAGGTPLAAISPRSRGDLPRQVRYLALPRSTFGDYVQVFATQLSRFYASREEAAAACGGVGGGAAGGGGAPRGRFLDIGGTGATAVGMRQARGKMR